MECHYSHHYKSRKLFVIQGKLRIEVPQEQLWGILTCPGHLENDHPFVNKHQKNKFTKMGDRDELVYYGGREMGREVIGWNEGESYTIRMTNGKNGNEIQVRFRALKIKANESEFSVKISSDAYRNVPRPFWYILVRYLVFNSYKKYLHSVLRGMDYYARTGKKVERDQFGKHRKFST